MKRILIVGLVLVLACAFVACSGGEDALIGAWQDIDGNTWEFKKDGVLIMADNEIRYKVSGNQVQIGGGDGEDFKAFDTLTLDGNELKNKGGVLATKK